MKTQNLAGSVDSLLSSVFDELNDIKASALRQERTGQVVGLFAILIPVLTWTFAYAHALDKEQLSNIWIITISSTTVAFTCGTICTILLKHSSTYNKRIDQLRLHRDHLLHVKAFANLQMSTNEAFLVSSLLTRKTSEIALPLSEISSVPSEELKNISALLIDSVKKHGG